MLGTTRSVGRDGDRSPPATVWLAVLAAMDVAVHLAVGNNYGYFRDELYYLIDGWRPALGYVDQAPLIGWLAYLTNLLFADSLFGIHIIPALAGGALVAVAGLSAREAGGGKPAQILAALGTLSALVFLATPSLFSMDVLDELWWTVAGYFLLRALRTGGTRPWLGFGGACAIGFLTKLTIFFFGFGVLVGLLLTPARASFRGRGFWLGGLLAVLGLLPYLAWNATHGWATVQFWQNYGGLSGGDPLGFLATQIVTLNPFTIPLTIAGLVFYFRGSAGRPFRPVGVAFVAIYLLLTLIHAKAYFLAPAYPMLWAGGAVWIERHAASRVGKIGWLRIYPAAIILSALLLAPLAMPLLPPATYARSYGALSFLGDAGAGQANTSAFPQYLADRFGWDSLTDTVAGVVDQLPADQRRDACIVTNNYGEASALLVLGKSRGLPPVISGHNNFALWGPGSCSGKVLITVNLPEDRLREAYGEVAEVARSRCQYCVGDENNIPIDLATQPRIPFARVWAALRHFD
ncbi:MAG TPA: glycosyltransferase family 39 protein [Chloroflexota bacterium]|nr:glycosyltransferase family 39 protein [Chloroflexota bacterium]